MPNEQVHELMHAHSNESKTGAPAQVSEQLKQLQGEEKSDTRTGEKTERLGSNLKSLEEMLGSGGVVYLGNGQFGVVEKKEEKKSGEKLEFTFVEQIALLTIMMSAKLRARKAERQKRTMEAKQA